ncbi:Nucleoside permease NupC [Winogradskyella psychrotolerans RS-3]|uniref:Nucleoside permease NupC n=1 Tax=Winogradskyella psychrotolerans RS-3 TaxID=641526 RepID=S7VTG4_9FLAO|nr:Nucleoside permease NupC [Winogradskyella psychrotolerans RS-3]
MNQFFKAFLAIFIGLSSITAQELEKTWESTASESTYKTLEFKKGEFNFSSNSVNSIKGDYMYQNNLLVLYHNDSLNSIKRYKITELTDSTLVFSGKEMHFNLVAAEEEAIVTPVSTIDEIIPNQGFSFTSLWRGILGMVTLIFIAFLFSSNRKAINWKTVGVGLVFQLVIAIGVLKVDFVKTVF